MNARRATGLLPPMSLRLSINLLVGLLTLLVLAIVLALQLRAMRASVNEEVQAATRVAAQLLNRMSRLYAAQGTPAMLAFLKDIGRVRSNDITLLNGEGEVLYRSPPSPYKSGRDAPDWFDRLVGPELTPMQIAYPDGQLIVTANASRATLDAWDDAVTLVLSALALLVVVNAGVFWIVGRTTRPFAEIVQALNALEQGRFDVSLQALPGREAGAIGAAFNRMVGMLQQHIETERRAVRAETRLSESRALSRWVDHQIEQERRLIARELHDELAQSVTAMRAMALSIAQRVQPLDAQAEQAARLIAEESGRLYQAMHGMIPRLTPLVLDQFGLVAALEDLAERTRQNHPGVTVQTQLAVAPERLALEADAALALYRAAQEGVTNALRHGQARQIRLRLTHDAAGLTLTLANDGLPLPPGGSAPAASEGHYGLRWLSERIAALGGEVQLAPALPSGVQLTVRLPVTGTAATLPQESA